MKNVLAGKTVLVTGGTGSIGCEIVRQALAQGADKVVVFSRDEIKHFMIKKRITDDRLQTMVGDVRDLRSVRQIFRSHDIDIIYHAAAMKHVVMCEDFPHEAVETNIMGSNNVVDSAIEYGVSKMITISTDKAAYPMNVMGATKLISERITLNANKVSKNEQAFSCVRFGNVAGSRGSVIPVYIDNLQNRTPLEVTDTEVTRFIMEIPDAVKLIIKATEYMYGGEICILKMRAMRLGDLIDVTLNSVAPRLNIAKENIKVNVTGLDLGEKLHEDLINDSESSQMYELDDMYIILPRNKSYTEYRGLSKASIRRYASSDVELLSKHKLEQIVMKYLKSRSLD